MSKFELIDLTRQAVAKTEEMLNQSKRFALSGLEEAINEAVNADYDKEFLVTFHTHMEKPQLSIHREGELLTVEIINDDVTVVEYKNMKIGTTYVIVETIKKWLGE